MLLLQSNSEEIKQISFVQQELQKVLHSLHQRCGHVVRACNSREAYNGLKQNGGIPPFPGPMAPPRTNDNTPGQKTAPNFCPLLVPPCYQKFDKGVENNADDVPEACKAGLVLVLEQGVTNSTEKSDP
jgi:hypothetical protein